MPGAEGSPLDVEDAGEELVVLQAECLDRGHHALEREGQRVAEQEHQDRGGRGADAPVPQRGGGPPDDRTQGGMGQPERCEPGEADDVRPEPDHDVEQLDARLGTGLYAGLGWLTLSGAVVTGLGLLALFAGLLAAAGGGVAGGAEAGVELFDIVVRLGSNVVSFARLAAFGLTHAALGAVVWQATTALWDRGIGAAVAAVLVFVAGNALAFTLEGIVATIQALRLEYYELFSRIFDIEGRPFRPWHVPLSPPEVSS